MASRGKAPETVEEHKESPERFLEDLIDSVSFVQDILKMTRTLLEEIQKHIYLLLEESRKRILKVAAELTTRAKEWKAKAEIQRILKDANRISLSDLDSTDSKEDEMIFTDTTTTQGEKTKEIETLTEPE